MVMRGFKVLGAIGIGIILLLLAAYPFRDALLAFAANRLLAPHQVAVHGVQGLNFRGNTITLQGVELVLRDTGLSLLLRNLELRHDWPYSGGTEPLALHVASARLVQDATLGEASDVRPGGELRLSELVQGLQSLPPGRLVVQALSLPDWQERIDIEVVSTADALLARIGSGDLILHSRLEQADSTAPVQLQAAVASGGVNAMTLRLRLTPAASGYQLTAEGELDIPELQAVLIPWLPQVPALPPDSPQLNWDLSAHVDDVIAATSDLELQAGIQADAALTIPAQVLPGLGAVRVDLGQRAVFAVRGLEHYLAGGDTGAGNIRITLQDNSRLSGILEPSSFGAYQLQAGFEIQRFQLDTGAAPGATLRIETGQLHVEGPQPWLPQMDLAADIALGDGLLRFDAALILPAAPADPGLNVRGHYDLGTGSAQLAATLPTVHFTPGENRSLSAWLGGWPWPFDLVTGSLAAELELNWQAAPEATARQDIPAEAGVLSGTLAVELVDATGYYGEYFFNGLNLPFAARIDTAAALALSTPPLRLTVALLDVGLALENLVLDFQVDGSKELLYIPAVDLETLGGRLHGDALSYRFGDARNPLTLKFTALRLENMLALVEYDGVAATGAVSGELPLTITSTGIEVAGGMLQADQPGGSIRYLAARTEGSNTNLDLVNRALSNYQFESLESTIDYRPDGELLLAMQLRGHNPDMNNGQRVNLNLTLSDNIPVLLESLQARRAIEDLLEERLQK